MQSKTVPLWEIYRLASQIHKLHKNFGKIHSKFTLFPIGFIIRTSSEYTKRPLCPKRQANSEKTVNLLDVLDKGAVLCIRLMFGRQNQWENCEFDVNFAEIFVKFVNL